PNYNKSLNAKLWDRHHWSIAIYYSLDDLLIQIQKLIDTLHIKVAEFQFVLKMGRTQLQDAVPMTLGQEFRAFATLLKEDIRL
ncbi:lyase family protein, partial [Pseudoalteromonas sp. SIMBA_148]